MAISKVVFNGTTLIDLTQDTASAGTIKTSFTAHDKSGEQVTGTYSGDVSIPTFTITYNNNDEITAVTCNMTFAECYNLIDSSDARTFVLIQGEGGIRYADMTCVPVSYASSSIRYTIFEAGSGEPAFDIIYSSYNGIEWIVPSLMMGEEGIPIATKGIVSNHAISITPSVANQQGYIFAGQTITGSPVSVSASELVSGTLSVSSSGTQDVTNYQNISVPSGTATAPSSISGTSATVSTGTNTLTLTKSVSVTPNVSTAGYISSGTAGNSSVSLTASVTTKAAATITPTTTNQTIASGTYLTGTQTIAGDADLVGSNILSTANIFGVQGTVTFQTYYTGSSAPTASQGVNGDIYLQT